jgi:hypothetical protein
MKSKIFQRSFGLAIRRQAFSITWLNFSKRGDETKSKQCAARRPFETAHHPNISTGGDSVADKSGHAFPRLSQGGPAIDGCGCRLSRKRFASRPMGPVSVGHTGQLA